MSRVLIVEDSPESYQLINRALSPSIQHDWAKSISEASKLLQEKDYDLVLLDIILPDGDGFRLCSILQADDKLRKIPIIFLTAKNSISDKVLGFSIGAEDYICKPFDPLELKARVESKLRKRALANEETDILHLGDIEINKATQKVNIYEQDDFEEVELTPLEFKLLIYLAKSPNKVVSRSEILDAVWGEDIHIYSRSVDTHISKLRKKLKSKSAYIKSVHGTGYRFVIPEKKGQPQLLVNAHNLPVSHA